MHAYKKIFEEVFQEMGKVIIGQEDMIKQILTALLCNGNALIEGYPGLAKTLAIKTLAQIMDLKYSRIQNTPDLMPSDVTGTYIIEDKGGKRDFKFHPGPVFANIILADEINRATPRTQSALLEAMQERQVTVGNETFKLDLPFFVLATQNPIEQEGSLELNQHVFVNGTLKTGKELLEFVGSNCIREDKNGIKLYNIDAWTLSLNTSGKLEKRNCLLYTLPYNDEMITVTTKTGKKLTVTKNHPFLVNENGLITWKKAEELTKQDYIINPARLNLSGMPKVMTHEEAVSRMKQKPIPREIPFDEDFAFWSAFLLSDGYIGEKCVEAMQKNYPEALDRFVEISKKYGFNPKVSTNRGCRYARIYSKPLVEYLNIRFGIESGKDKGIPSWFLSFPAKMNKEFLKTFISLESSLRDNRIVFTQKSAKNINVISYMLLREGILPWIRHDGRIFRLKIQGKDVISYLQQIGWICEDKTKTIDLNRTIKSVFRVVPVNRKSVLRIVELLGINSFHTLKNRKKLTSRKWYGSYKGIKEGETVMSVDSLNKMVADVKEEIELRKQPSFLEKIDNNPRFFAASMGLPMTEIAQQLAISKNQVWTLYQTGDARQAVQIKAHMSEQYKLRIKEAEKLLSYLKALLSKDIFYDKIKSIEYSASEGTAFGLTVPELQNYVAGFGGCGINHNTYPLPEAQTDRFLLKIKVGYPTPTEEAEIMNKYAMQEKEQRLKTVLDKNHLFALQNVTRQVPISHDLKEKIVKIVVSTRERTDMIQYGASPRASIGLLLAAKAHALIEGRNHVSIEDIRKIAYPVLRHRLILNFEAERKGLTTDDAVTQILSQVK